MEKSRSNGLLLIVAGVVFGVVSANADGLGLGVPGYSWEQGLMVFLGALAIIAGAYLMHLDGRLLVLAGLVITGALLMIDKTPLGSPGISCPHGIALFVGVAIFLMGVNSLRTKS